MHFMHCVSDKIHFHILAKAILCVKFECVNFYVHHVFHYQWIEVFCPKLIKFYEFIAITKKHCNAKIKCLYERF